MNQFHRLTRYLNDAKHAAVLAVDDRRALYPALAHGPIYLDGPGGSQVPQPVIDAVGEALREAMSNTGGTFASSANAAQAVEDARAAVGDLLGAAAEDVVLGASTTALVYQFAAALAREWTGGDEILVTRLDHDANVRPWVQAAERIGARVRWADVELPSGELPTEQFERLVTERTRVVALTAASNVLGTRPDVRAIAEIAHQMGALVFVDAVHAVQHHPVSVADLGADFVACSAYKFFGPHVAAVAARSGALERVEPWRLAPAPDSAPASFDVGTPPFELLAGLTAAVDHLAGLSPGGSTRRAALAATMSEFERYCSDVFAELAAGLAAIEGVEVIGEPTTARAPTVAFRIAGQSPAAVAAALAERGLCVGHGSFYAYELARRLGVYERGGAVRAAVLHYNTRAEVRELLDAVGEIAKATCPA
jgi:cysteine desulfurase family protein (TIGR01976 family)